AIARTAENFEENIGLDSGFVTPPFTITDVSGKHFSRDDLKGKPVMIFFTTTWCVPCQIGAQNLAKYDLETGDNAFNVVIVFVDPSETDQQLKNWKSRFAREDWLIAKDNGMASLYKMQYLDTKYVLDAKSSIRWVDLQPLEYQSAKNVLTPLLK
ncbi:MAG: TlpA family protein disulfide reductase, partial [Candidatus Aenigmarchaeota archaeon]|nr:TlpA family protein disulfide reductase [Candidatus Aenigmarchaeota archaeon]